MFETMLLAVDGSEHSQRAARVAGDLARAVKARELCLVVAYEPIPHALGEPNLSDAIEARTEEAQAILAKSKAEIGSLPMTVNTEILEGPAAEAILKVAATRKSDIIIMGSRGLGRLEGALLGSHSQKVVSQAVCPVLIVR